MHADYQTSVLVATMTLDCTASHRTASVNLIITTK